jgi:hypothetical protein
MRLINLRESWSKFKLYDANDKIRNLYICCDNDVINIFLVCQKNIGFFIL